MIQYYFLFLLLLLKPAGMSAIVGIFFTEVTAKTTFFANHLYQHDGEEKYPYK